MNRRMINQTVGTLFSVLLLAQTLFLVAQAQPTTEATVEQFLRSDSLLPGVDTKTQQLYASLKTWLGSYQGIRKEGNDYRATFEYGSLPVSVRLNAEGQIESAGVGCPSSESLSLSQAPGNLKQALSNCPNLRK